MSKIEKLIETYFARNEMFGKFRLETRTATFQNIEIRIVKIYIVKCQTKHVSLTTRNQLTLLSKSNRFLQVFI